MKITVHDVGHGQCISLVHENGNVMLWDCGHASWGRPSDFLRADGITRIDVLTITNYDEDHISDLPNVIADLNVRAIRRNRSVSPETLRTMKLEGGPLTPAMKTMLTMLDIYTGGPPDPPPEFPDVTTRVYCNHYPDFEDTNNLSVVTFLQARGLNLAIPGDLERPGWEALLRQPAFQDDLRRTNAFIASHHGRENGYHKEIFEFCTPDVVIFSDSAMQHATQEMAATYHTHALGIAFNGERRHVLTTRNDGSISWIR